MQKCKKKTIEIYKCKFFLCGSTGHRLCGTGFSGPTSSMSQPAGSNPYCHP